MNNDRQWRFDPLDSWFFREARAFDISGSNELNSLFPPPARTVAGAVRTLIGETQGVDWQEFASAEKYTDLKQSIGSDDDLGALRIRGPYPLWNNERLYPAPLHLLAKEQEYVFLKPGVVVQCDLGKVKLPKLEKALSGAKPLEEKALSGAKPLENAWLTSTDLQRVLKGKLPEKVWYSRDLYSVESRLGIARNNAQRTVADGLLYQTRHIRPRAELAIGATVSGIDPELYSAHGVIRFGGEGRASTVTVEESSLPLVEAPKTNSSNLLLVLLTHADFDGKWELPGFHAETQGDVKIWRGIINGIELILHSAVLGKAVREGGWDLLNKKPRPVQSLIPAGSVYFCTVQGDVQAAVKTLHGCHIGQHTALGRGELAIGFW